MDRSKVINTDYYVISDDFRLLDFNQNVKERYQGIQQGDLCYQATMKRDTPCPHCPIAGNIENDCPVYYDPFYRDWVEAIFSEIGDGKYAVTCHPANGDARSMFQRLKIDDLPLEGNLLKEYDSENIGMIGGYCEDGFPLYYVNERMIEMLGYDSREDFEKGIDKKVVNTIHPDDLPQVIADLGNHYYAGMKYETTYRMPRKDGTWFWTVDRGEVIEASDGRLAIISACLDVTEAHDRAEEKAQLELTKAASAAKSAFLFNMSHDIRTPMNAIIGFTDLLKKHLDDKELAKSYIEKIETANDFLMSLINNVLEMARIESGKVYLDETACDVYLFWEALFALFDTQMKEKGITYISDIRVEHPNIMADETKIREIFLNIVSNAVKYTPAGGTVSMTLTELPTDCPGYLVYQTVIEDTGIGMAEEYLPHIFEEFTRERTSTESKVAGTGLGMPIVKKLVDLMQGTIEVESELGKGTKFTVTLSHRIADATNTRLISEHSNEYKMEDFAGKRILLAEDNELNAEIAMTILEEEGFLVERAEDGIICVNMIEKATSDYYDLILMDIQMPNMDGYKATQIIRRLPDKQKANIPIIAMTANAFEEDRKKAFHMGMNGHIAKPIQIEILKNTLGCMLSNKETDKEIR